MDTLKSYVENEEDIKVKGRHLYWYIYAIVEGKLYVDGAYATEQDALHFGSNKIGAYFETIELPTKDLSQATRMCKHRLLSQTGDLAKATARAKHKL